MKEIKTIVDEMYEAAEEANRKACENNNCHPTVWLLTDGSVEIDVQYGPNCRSSWARDAIEIDDFCEPDFDPEEHWDTDGSLFWKFIEEKGLDAEFKRLLKEDEDFAEEWDGWDEDDPGDWVDEEYHDEYIEYVLEDFFENSDHFKDVAEITLGNIIDWDDTSLTINGYRYVMTEDGLVSEDELEGEDEDDD